MRRHAWPLPAAVIVITGAVYAGDPPDRPADRTFLAAAADATTTLSAIEEEEKKAKGELDAMTQTEQQLRRRVIVRGRVFYELTKVGLLPVGGGFSDFVEHAVRVGRARWALGHDLEAMRQLTERRVALSRKLDDLVVRKAPLELEREAAARAKALLDEAEDRRRAFERAFDRSTGSGDYVAVYGGTVRVGERGGDDGFTGLRGRLPFPLAGRAEVRVVRRPGTAGPGVEMAAAAGSPVRAVYSGRVAFADRYDPLGQVVILDHGDHYYTLMGNLGSIEVRVGDDLSAGARVGTIGQGPGGPMLYFEIRKGSATLDPKPWLGL